MFKNKYQGRFITIEGLDGSGCSTQTDRLAEWLKKQKLSYLSTKEPTNNVIGGLIRGYLRGEWKTISHLSLQLLFTADRANHLDREIIPNLEKGVNVVSDRYFLSSIAYGSQNIGDEDWLYQINNQFIIPDLTILLKVSAKTCIKRIKENRLSLEMFDTEEKLQKVWQTYEKISKKYPNIKVIDGEKSEDEIFEEILKEVKKLLKISA